ncbi:hypothetical protein [Aquibacillus salsiterrae]|uniref:Uncharacterized protein n=1 Tax=Aquibacillus salsiterrae TaxID=2950439 RepID=A0A9X3WGS9_9BACI|nr:hypothetical protein [Aquibacillus salsiterrae]MDC3418110.1 hypothetical protein [Aquibacillus salsiterrae]
MTVLFTKAKELMEKDDYNQQTDFFKHSKNPSTNKKNLSAFFKRKAKK